MKTLAQSWHSIAYFIGLVTRRSLHVSKRELRNQYRIGNNQTYEVFRVTVSDKEYGGEEVVLIIGFRLKFIGKNRFFHWWFQRLCVLDTPIWVGFPGFKTKYWMVEPETKDYLGLYRYQGKDNAQRYADYICSVLRPVSIRQSIWYKIEEVRFNLYTNNHGAA